VTGTTKANDAYWNEKCKLIPIDATFLMLDMGSVRDFFLRAGRASWCEMLTSETKHYWSPNGLDWDTPKYIENAAHHQGGSKEQWPKNNVDGDERAYLSIWGDDEGGSGGCCTSSYSQNLGNPLWGHRFTFAYAVPLQPPPPNTGTIVIVTNDGTGLANDAYWKKMCQQIPANALFLMLTMGESRDFFKPIKDANWCTMLASRNKHQFSQDGLVWVVPDYNDGSTHNRGGSAETWPENHVIGDARNVLSMWGNGPGSKVGGCCSSSHASYHIGWGQPFNLAFGLQLEPPPPNTAVAVFVAVAGTIQANDAFWNVECQKVPADTAFLFLVRCSALDWGVSREDALGCPLTDGCSRVSTY
jgi:hypothetical protein